LDLQEEFTLESIDIFQYFVLSHEGESLKSPQYTKDMILTSLRVAHEEILGVALLFDGAETFFNIPVLVF